MAMAGVVRPARVPTTPRWLPPVLPLLIQGGELFLVLMSPCIAHSSVSSLPWPLNRPNSLECYGFPAFISISAVLFISFSLAKSTADLPSLFLWDTFAPLSNNA